MVSFLDIDENDPVERARLAGEAITAARKAAEERGIKAFLFHASSEEEFDERAAVREVAEVLDGIVASYLGSRADGRSHLVSVLKREFTAQAAPQRCPFCNQSIVNPEQDHDPDCMVNAYPDEKVLHHGKTAAYRDYAHDTPCDTCGCDADEHWDEWDDDQDGEAGCRSCMLCDGFEPRDPDLDDEGFVKSEKEDSPCPICGLARDHDDHNPVNEGPVYPGANTAKTASARLASDTCPGCGTTVDVESLRDDASVRESSISGMCQNCQDDYFGKTASEAYVFVCPKDGTRSSSAGPIAFPCRTCGGETHRDREAERDTGDKTAAVEEFPSPEDPLEEASAEPRLPDWMSTALAADGYTLPKVAVEKTAGGVDFSTTATGKTVDAAFRQAVEEAQYESGHGGYTGTIAEKGDYTLFNPPQGVKGETLIKHFHDFQGRIYDRDRGDDFDSRIDYQAIGDSRPNIKECRKCESKYTAPPKGARKPQPNQYGVWAKRGDSAAFKAANPDVNSYSGHSPYEDELEQLRASRGWGRNNTNWNKPDTQPSPRETELGEKHRQYVKQQYDDLGGNDVYSPFREGVCHNCGNKPLRRERPIPVELRRTLGQMHETYNDKWGPAVAVPLGKGRYHFMGVASS